MTRAKLRLNKKKERKREKTITGTPRPGFVLHTQGPFPSSSDQRSGPSLGVSGDGTIPAAMQVGLASGRKGRKIGIISMFSGSQEYLSNLWQKRWVSLRVLLPTPEEEVPGQLTVMEAIFTAPKLIC